MFNNFITILDKNDILFNKDHESIQFISFELRDRKFKDNEIYINNNKSNEQKPDLFRPGTGVYNKYYIKDEPIKCWLSHSSTTDNPKCVIQDGHRRFIEGLLIGHSKFLVEFTSTQPKYIEQSNILKFEPNQFTFNYSNESIDISSDNKLIFLKTSF